MILNKFYIVIKHGFKFVFKSLFQLTPKPKNIWSFKGFGDLYIDNSMYLFEYLHDNEHLYKGIRLIWVTADPKTFLNVKKKGYQVFMRNTMKGKFYLFRSKYHFYGDYPDYFISNKTLSVNLWHGIGIKKMDFDIKTGPLKALFNDSFISRIKRPDIYRKPNFVISSSKYVTKNIFSSAFRVNENNCLNFGYPRNDIFFRNLKNTNIFDFRKNNISNRVTNKSKVYIYMPTWRDSGNNFILDSGIDFEKLNNKLLENNDFFILKLHPNTKLNINLEEYSNILTFPENMELYKFLNYIDVLITDYSSVFFDFLLTGKKIIYFPFDLKKYSDERGFNFNYYEITSGKVVFNFEELLSEMINLMIDDKKHNQILNKIWEYKDGNASKRIANYFYEM
jgi:CDP-glycerol glycerophosphotransferase (TagB/SpsB family)